MKVKTDAIPVTPDLNNEHGIHGRTAEPSYYKLMTKNTSAWVALGVVVVTTLFYLLTHHKTHVLDVLPYALFLAIILMHIFMHGGHNHEGHK
jgi:branched-subunit amino acid transport protein